MKKYKSVYKYMMGTILLLYIGGISVLNIFTPARAFSEMENRKLEQKPEFSLHELVDGNFTSNYEKYIADQFPLKDFWIGVKSNFEKATGKKEYNGVYIGKDNYLLQDFKKPDNESFQSKVDALNTFAASTPGLNKYVMLVPNSVEILRGKLPPYAQVESEKNWTQRVQHSLNKNIKFIDVYETLYSKRNENIFYKTDHHWTTKGAFYAYQKFMQDTGRVPNPESNFDIKNVTNSFYGSLYSKSGLTQMPPDSMNLYQPKNKEQYKVEYFDEEGKENVSTSLYSMDNLAKKDKYAVFLNGNHPLIKISTPNASGKKLLIIKDSYANSFIPFLTGHYSEIYVVDLRYYSDDLGDVILKNNIKDMLVLYNVNTFFEDSSVESILDYIDLDRMRAESENVTVQSAPASSGQNKADTTSKKYNYKEFFKEDVFMGDSITDAISYMELLEQRNVCAKVGINITEAKPQINKIKIKNPRNIYLLYGVNDMDDRMSSEWFVGQYRDLVRNVKKKFPASHIYVQSILPVEPSVERRSPHTNNRHITKCNDGLMKMTKEENVGYLNIASVLNNNSKGLYEHDGTHFKAPFYKLWFNYLIETMGNKQN